MDADARVISVLVSCPVLEAKFCSAPLPLASFLL